MKNPDTRDEAIIRLEDGQPLVFGTERQRAVVRDSSGFGLTVVDADTVSPDQIVRHDASREDPAYAFALSRLSGSDLSHTPMGIFRQVDRPTYDNVAREQVRAQAETASRSLDELLRGNDTWTVH